MGTDLKTETVSNLTTMFSDRNPQYDLFICDVENAVLKDVMQHMEHPFYSLSKKPDTAVRRYEHNGHWLEITPSVKGLATIYDKDILIYCISQVMSKIRQGEPVSQRVRINSRDLLICTNRGTSGRDYMALVEALDRLEGTRVRTSIVTGDEEQTEGFGLIDASTIKRKHGLDGRLLWCEIKLSDWVFNAIRANEVLTLNRDYFRLRKPIERRVYEIVRKHCGQQESWPCSMSILLKKTGSRSTLKEFRRAIRHLVRHNYLPDYAVEFDKDRDQVIFRNRGSVFSATPSEPDVSVPSLKPETYEKAKALVPGWDVYSIEREWREWMTKPPHVPNAAFLGFCKKWHEKHGFQQ